MSRLSRISRRHQYLFPLLAVGALSLAGLGAARADSAASDDPVAAVVDGKTLHRSDLAALLQQFARQYPNFQGASVTDPQLYPRLLNQLISNTLLYSAAEKSKIERDPDVKKALADARQSIVTDFYERQLAREAATADAEQAYYQQLVTSNPGAIAEIHARQIIVDSESDATDVIAQLAKGADFAQLVKDKSLDKDNGGELPWFTKAQIMPEIGAVAFTLHKGEYTKTPVHTKYGWHVIQLLDTRPAPLADVKDMVDFELAGDAIRKKVSAMREKSKITEYDLDGKPVQSK